MRHRRQLMALAERRYAFGQAIDVERLIEDRGSPQAERPIVNVRRAERGHQDHGGLGNQAVYRFEQAQIAAAGQA